MRRQVLKLMQSLPGGTALINIYRANYVPRQLPSELEKAYNINQIQKFEVLLNRNSQSLRHFNSILEFGCGRGRLLQYIFRLVPQAKVFGCDIVPETITYCRRKYPQGSFSVKGIHYCELGALFRHQVCGLC